MLSLSSDVESGGKDGGIMHLDGSPIMGDKPVHNEPQQLDKKEKMTYTEQAAKRQLCQRLTRYAWCTLILQFMSDTTLYSFIRLCDYLVITMLHKMAVVSADAILETFEYQTNLVIEITDLVQPIPDSTEEQESLLQVKSGKS